MSHKLLQFVNSSTDLSSAISGTYNLWLVALSVLVASVAAYCALQIAERLSKSETVSVKNTWLVLGAIAMGCGIWTMHFVGMLAFSLPIAVTYDLTITLVSMMPGIIASAVALHLMSKPDIDIWRLNLGGVLMGVGIGAMHYTGMAAMIMHGSMRYDPLLFALSIVVAHVLATLSLYVKFVLAKKLDSKKTWPQIASAAIMGCAVAGMHYTGMTAAYYFPGEGVPGMSQGLTSVVLGLSVTLASTIVLAVAIISALIDRRLQSTSDALQYKERQIQNILDTSNEAIISVDETQRIITFNKGAEAIFAYAAHEVMGQSLDVLIPLNCRANHAEHVAEFARSGTHAREMNNRQTVCGRRKNGTEFPAEASISKIEIDGKKILSVFLRDITERKRAEEALQKSEEQLSQAVEISSDGMWDWNIKTGEVYFSEQWCKSLGYDAAEMENHLSFWESIVHPDDLAKVMEAVNAHFEEKTSIYEIENRLLTKSGTYRFNLARGKVVDWDKEGKPVRMIGVDIDITKRRGAEEALKESERKYRILFNQIADAILIFDKETHRFLDCNDSVQRIYGYSKDELKSMTPSDLHPPEELEKVKKNVDVKNVDVPNTYTHLTKDGRRIDVEILTNEIEYQGREAWISIVRDITERKLAAEELHQAMEAAEAANHAKSEFLANMSHEIRTPMNGVIGMTGLLVDTKLDKEQRDYAETIVCSAEALMAVVNDILDFSKIEAGKLSIEPIPFDLKVAVKEVAGFLGETAGEKKLDLQIHYAPDVPTRLIGDPGRIRQIILNLAGNALKFTEKGHVSVNVEQVDLTENDVKLKISVADTGIGIPKEKQHHIFDRFSQADASTTRKFGGTGLGLAISKQLIDLMNGKIYVTSEPGKGATFTFEIALPLDKQRVTEPASVAELKEVKFLIVEDHETDKKIIQEQFKNSGLGYDSVESAGEALPAMHKALSDRQPYQIAIIDYRLAEMNGETLARTIKADPDLKETVLVMLTSAAKKGDAKRFKEAGFTAFLTKSIQPSLLMETLATVWAAKVRGHSTELITSHSVVEARAHRADMEKPATQAKSIRVLLAEDNIINQKVEVQMLQKLNCRVDVAANGSEAVEMVRSFPYALLFMDCQMPEMNGFEATAAIRKWESENTPLSSSSRGEAKGVGELRIPVIAMTANAMKGDRERCLEAGMDDYISKPVNAGKLREALERWVGRSEDEHVDRVDKVTIVRENERP